MVLSAAGRSTWDTTNWTLLKVILNAIPVNFSANLVRNIKLSAERGAFWTWSDWLCYLQSKCNISDIICEKVILFSLHPLLCYGKTIYDEPIVARGIPCWSKSGGMKENFKLFSCFQCHEHVTNLIWTLLSKNLPQYVCNHLLKAKKQQDIVMSWVFRRGRCIFSLLCWSDILLLGFSLV